MKGRSFFLLKLIRCDKINKKNGGSYGKKNLCRKARRI